MDGLPNMTLKFCTSLFLLMGMVAHFCLGNVAYSPPNRYDSNRYNDDSYLQPSIRSYVSPNYNSAPSRSPNYNNYDRNDNYDRDNYRGRSGSSKDRYPSRQKDYDRDDRYDSNYDGGRGNGRDYSYRSSSRNDYDRDYFNYPNSYIKPTYPVCTTKTTTTTTTETATPSCSTASSTVYQLYVDGLCFRTGSATVRSIEANVGTTTPIGTFAPCTSTIPLPTIKKAYAYAGSTSTSVPCIGTITSTKIKYSGITCTFSVQETRFESIKDGQFKQDACPFTSATTHTTCYDSNSRAVTALKQMRTIAEDDD